MRCQSLVFMPVMGAAVVAKTDAQEDMDMRVSLQSIGWRCVLRVDV